MQHATQMQDTVLISGDVLATGVSYEDFLAQFDGQHVEWVNGVVIQMASITERHDATTRFLATFFQAFLELSGGGRVLQDPMVMRLEAIGSARAPDIQILLPDKLSFLKDNQVVGPADLVVEVVSPTSHRRDRVEKFSEYERGGVPEYWIIDSIYKETLFYHLGEDGLYERRKPDNDDIYHSLALKGFRLKIDLLWREELPGVFEIARMVENMLNKM